MLNEKNVTNNMPWNAYYMPDKPMPKKIVRPTLRAIFVRDIFVILHKIAENLKTTAITCVSGFF